MTASAIVGAILGTAVGDAIGLPYEGISKRRGVKVFGPPNRHHFLFGRGMVSDDTEHTCMAAQALIVAGNDVKRFQRSLAWRLRWWLLGLPAGIGMATLKSSIKLWLGFPSSHSGVFSAGNGPAMRAAVLGAAIRDLTLLQQFVRASTRITHTDPKAENGAIAVALAAHLASAGRLVAGAEYLQQLRKTLPDAATEFLVLAEKAVVSAANGESTEDFAIALKLGRGVSGYIYHTVPVVLQAWLHHQSDFRAGVEAIVRCGGDTDTTAAILGGILGAGLGKAGIPTEWRDGICEWPRTILWMEHLGEQLAMARESGVPRRAPRLLWPAVLARNLFFAAVVLFHGFRRLAPPY